MEHDSIQKHGLPSDALNFQSPFTPCPLVQISCLLAKIFALVALISLSYLPQTIAKAFATEAMAIQEIRI